MKSFSRRALALLIIFSACLPAFAAGPFYVNNVAFNGAPQYSGDGGSAQAASIYSPDGIAVDNAGNVYVADNQSNVIRKISAAGVVTTFAGTGTQGFSGDGGPATAAMLSQPYGIKVDAAGNVFFCDRLNMRIRKIDTSGIITTVAGNGSQGASGNGGPATAATLNFPEGLAFAPNGDLYIADTGNAHVRVLNTAGNITLFANLNTTFGVKDIAVDSASNVYVTDNNYTVRQLTQAGGNAIIAGTSGTSGFSGDGGPATSAKLFLPRGITVDAGGTVYVVDAGNYVIRAISGGVINTVSGIGGQPAFSPGNLASGVLATSTQVGGGPTRIFAAPNGDIYYTDTTRVRRLSLTNTTSPTITSLALPGGVVGIAYSAAPVATGTAPITWNFSGGTLPPGLTFSPTGTLSGTPTQVGNFTFQLDALNGGATNATQSYTISITSTAQPHVATNQTGSIPFGSVAVGVSSAPQTVTFYNNGSLPFQVTAITSNISDFQATQTANCPGLNVSFPPGAACTLSIVYTPSAAGNAFNNLSVTTTMGTLNIFQSGAGTANALSAAISFNPNTVLPGANSVMTITMANSNAVAATGVGFTLPYTVNMSNSGPNNLTSTCTLPQQLSAQAFTGSIGAFGIGVPPGGCTIQVTVNAQTVGPNTVTMGVGSIQSNNLPANTSAISGTLTVQAAGGPVFTANPASTLSFGSQNVNTPTASQSVTVTNTGSAALSFSAISTSNPDYAITHNCPIAVAALGVNASCTVNVTFTPTHVGIDNGVLNFTTNAPGSPQAISLFGNGAGVVPAPTVGLSFSPATVTVNGVGALTVTLSSTLAGTTNIVSGAVSVPAGLVMAPNTVVTGTCGSGGGVTAGSFQFSQGTIPANGSCTVIVQLQGVTVGNYMLTFAAGALSSSSGTNASAASAPANVSATAGVVFNPTSLTFGTQGIGTTSVVQRAVLKNGGTTPLTISSIAALGDFGFVTDCPLTGAGTVNVVVAPPALAAGGTCNIDVTFSPLTPGLQNSFVYVYDNAPNGPHALSISGQGVQIALPTIAVTPRTLTFDDRVVGSVSPAQTISVANNGQANLNLSAIQVAGASFSRVTATPAASDCGTVVAPGANCLIAIVFAPGTVGANTGSVTISHNVSATAIVVALNGNGTPVPQPLIRMVEAISFGDQIIGTSSTARNLAITNFGTAPLSVSSVQIAGANAGDFTLAGTCANAVAPGASCTVTITFKPTVIGVKAAQVNVVSNAQNAASVNKVVLSGNGVPVPVPVIRVTATALGFGNVIYGGNPAVQSVTVFNAGTGPLVIQQITMTGNTDFSQSSDCNGGVGPQGQCTIAVKFAPHAIGARAGVMKIFSNADGSPNQVQLSGTGCRYYSPTAARTFLSAC